jgi:hypothetical protein
MEEKRQQLRAFCSETELVCRIHFFALFTKYATPVADIIECMK